MFTIVAWSESVNPAGAFTKLAAVPDQHIRTSGDSIYVNQYNRLLGGMACVGNTLPGEARFVAPSIRRKNPHYITPVIDQIYPTTYPVSSVQPGPGLVLDPDEQLEVEESSTPGVGEQHSIVAWLANAAISPVTGQIVTVNANITLALAAGAWTFSELEFVDDLAVGNYQVVGMRVVADEAIAARLIPVGGDNRPGVPCVAGVFYSDFQDRFRYGKMGKFCEFSHNNPPSVELLGSAVEASDTYEVYLDLIMQ